MTVVDELIAWLRQQLDEDERVAREASRRGQDGSTLTGEHWHWIEPDYDEVLALDPMLDEYLNDGGRAELRSVEEYPSSVGPLPHFVLRDADVVHTVDAMHIARWDPKRVLDEVKAKRQILDDRGEAAQDAAKNHNEPGFLAYVDALDAVVHHLAQPYAGRDGWREEWRI